MSKPYVFVLITAKTCSACHTFLDNHWSGIHVYLTDDPNYSSLEVKHLELASTAAEPLNNIHRGFSKAFDYFPAILIFPRGTWEDPNLPLVRGENYFLAENRPYTADNVLDWVDDVLRQG